jgi:hypothetical protein
MTGVPVFLRMNEAAMCDGNYAFTWVTEIRPIVGSLRTANCRD